MSFSWSAPSHCAGSVCWDRFSAGNVPENAVRAGVDQDGGQIFVGRAMHEGDLLPAKVLPSHGGAFVCYNGEEITKLEYEVLRCGHAAWTLASGGNVPSEAIQVGQTSSGEPLYVGRTLHQGIQAVGKLHPSHGVLYVPYQGQEINFREYEVLILY